MTDKVHPSLPSSNASANAPLLPPPATTTEAPKQQQQPDTYVIHVAKDQIFRVPPPENAALFESYSRRSSRSRHRSCLRFLLYLLLVLISFAIIISVVFYFVVQPRFPSLSVSRLDLASSLSSPAFVAGFHAENPNKKMSIRYLAGGSVIVSYSGDVIASGSWPEFYQPRRGVTEFNATLSGAGVRLPKELISARGAVAFAVEARAPVKLKFAGVSSWTLKYKARCDVTVDALKTLSKIVSRDCRVRLRL